MILCEIFVSIVVYNTKLAQVFVTILTIVCGKFFIFTLITLYLFDIFTINFEQYLQESPLEVYL